MDQFFVDKVNVCDLDCVNFVKKLIGNLSNIVRLIVNCFFFFKLIIKVLFFKYVV